MRKEFGLRLCAVTLPMILLAACGGGGGVGSTPTPTTSTSTGTTTAGTTTTSTTNATTTTTTTASTTTTSSSSASTSTTLTPATTKSTLNYDDAEYQRSNAVTSSNAITAYQNGATGRGVKIAVVDSGLSDPLGQFTGRIDAASTDLVSNRGIADEGGHGTSVAAVAAAGRNGSDIMGVAFDATVLVARTDTVGSCASDKGCNHPDSAIAKGVDLARTNGARVINISLGGYAASSTLINAVRQATQAGIVVVIAAGNDGTADPDAFAQMAANNMNGMVIIAGSHESDNSISSFTDKAGAYSAYYLTALGDGVRAFNQAGKDYYYTGTSYAAPTIAGAVAVLAQAFPTLTGKQIVDLLYATATDAGDSGVDGVFGHGILDLAKAFQPQGSTSLAGSAVAVSTTSVNGVTGAAMGDAAQSGTSSGARAVILDGYGRAYDIDLGRTLAATPGARPLGNALVGGIRSTGLSSGPIAVSVNLAADRDGYAPADVRALGLDQGSARAARMLSARMLTRVNERTQALFGWHEGAGRLSAMLDGRADLPFIVARDSDTTFGLTSTRGPSLALRRDLGFVGLTLSGESGSTAPMRIARNRDIASFSAANARFDRRFGALSVAAGIGVMREDRSVLGARFGAALGGGGALSTTIDLRAGYDLGRGWQAAIAARQGWTRADPVGPLTGGRLTSNAFAVDIAHVGLASRFGLRVAQPLRVASGGLNLTLPTSYDYDTGAIGYSRSTLNLVPQGREMDVEASYGRALGKGWLDANAFIRRQPDHFASAASDAGMALRYGLGF